MNPTPKADLILKTLYQLGGVGTTQQMYEKMSVRDIEDFKVSKLWIAQYIQCLKNYYLRTQHKSKWWGDGGQTYILLPRTMNHYREKEHELVDTSIPSETPD